jgi:hypothetical protein
MASNRLAALANRRIDAAVAVSKANEVYERLAEDDAIRYAIGAMQPIDQTYTRNTIAEGERVQSQIDEALRTASLGATFRFQGSVTNDTHIRAHSDIDLLAIRTAFEWLEPPQVPQTPYHGSPAADMNEVRSIVTARLQSSFPSATVDTSSSKSISISGGSLRRKVDVVPAAWWNTNTYLTSGDENQRGVKIFDASTEKHIPNKPFLHNLLVAQRDIFVRGSLRKVARLLKSLKVDADKPVDVSSYDIVSIAYRMPDALLSVPQGGDLKLVANSEVWLRTLIENPGTRGLLQVPNEMRLIFGSDGCSEGGLRQLHAEVVRLLADISSGLARSFRKLEEARIVY